MPLTPEIDAIIVGRVAPGCFRGAGEAVRAALRLLKEGLRNAPGRWSQVKDRQVGR